MQSTSRLPPTNRCCFRSDLFFSFASFLVFLLLPSCPGRRRFGRLPGDLHGPVLVRRRKAGPRDGQAGLRVGEVGGRSEPVREIGQEVRGCLG